MRKIRIPALVLAIGTAIALALTACGGSTVAPAGQAATQPPADSATSPAAVSGIKTIPAADQSTSFNVGVMEYMYNGGCELNPAWANAENAGNMAPTPYSTSIKQCLTFYTTPWPQTGGTTGPVKAANFTDWCQYQLENDGASPSDVAGCVWAATVYAPANPNGGSALVSNEGEAYTAPPPGSVPPSGQSAGYDFAYSNAYRYWNGQVATELAEGYGSGLAGATKWCGYVGVGQLMGGAIAGPGTVAQQTAGCLAGIKAAGGP